MSSPIYTRNARRKSHVLVLSRLFHRTTGRHEGEQGHGRTSQGQAVWVISPNTEHLWPPSDTCPQRLVTPTSSAETCLLTHWRKRQPSHMSNQPTNQKPPSCPRAPPATTREQLRVNNRITEHPRRTYQSLDPIAEPQTSSEVKAKATLGVVSLRRGGHQGATSVTCPLCSNSHGDQSQSTRDKHEKEH